MKTSKTLKNLRERQSVKSFNNTVHIISESARKQILEAANLAPSSHNMQPYKIFWLTESALKKHPGLVYGKHQENAKGCAIVVSYMNTDAYSWLNTIKQTREYNTIPERYEHETGGQLSNEWSRAQSYIPMLPMMNTARDLGISSCPIEGIKTGAIRTALEIEIGKPFNYPEICDDYQINYVIMFGYAKESTANKIRRDVTQVIN